MFVSGRFAEAVGHEGADVEPRNPFRSGRRKLPSQGPRSTARERKKKVTFVLNRIESFSFMKLRIDGVKRIKQFN